MREYRHFSIINLTIIILSVFGMMSAVHSQELFERNLRFGDQGQDVQRLQEFLNRHGAPVSDTGPGSHGNETDFFGTKTFRAVKIFQELNQSIILEPLGLSVGTGNFFSSTRNLVNTVTTGDVLTYGQLLRSPETQSQKNKYTIGGTISGIVDQVIVSNNGGEQLMIHPEDTAQFNFSHLLASGDEYRVTAKPLVPGKQLCYVSKNGSGVVADHSINTIQVQCGPTPFANPFESIFTGGGSQSYTLGGTASGLLGTLVLRLNTGQVLTLTADGVFEFGSRISKGSIYSVIVETHPTVPAQTCSISNGSGTMQGDVTSISVSCISIPTIELASISKTYGDSPFSISITSTSDGVITYTSSNTSTATISGNTVTMVNAGSTTITATQAATATYAATSTTAILTVGKANPVITALSNFTFDSSDYSGICFEDTDTPVPYCAPDSGALILDLPTSTSNGLFTSLAALNSDVIPTSTEAVEHVLGYPVIDSSFYFGSLAFDLFNLLTPGPFTATATLYQAATMNYNAASTTFTIIMNLVQDDPVGNFCANHGVMMRPAWGGVYGEYECSCPTEFTGQYCQTVVPG